MWSLILRTSGCRIYLGKTTSPAYDLSQDGGGADGGAPTCAPPDGEALGGCALIHAPPHAETIRDSGDLEVSGCARPGSANAPPGNAEPEISGCALPGSRPPCTWTSGRADQRVPGLERSAVNERDIFLAEVWA